MPRLSLEPGDEKILIAHEAFMERAAKEGGMGKTWFNFSTPEPVRAALERARINCWLVRIWLGDTTTGQPWLEEHDVVGQIRRSGGLLKVPLLFERGGDGIGGPAILDHCIVRIEHWTKQRPQIMDQILYTHPLFRYPTTEVVYDGEGEPKDFKARYAVRANGSIYAGAQTLKQANKIAAFVGGKSIAQP